MSKPWQPYALHILDAIARWNPQAGEDFYLVLNYGFDSEGVFSQISREKAEIAIK